jgi:hypothetical protein
MALRDIFFGGYFCSHKPPSAIPKIESRSKRRDTEQTIEHSGIRNTLFDFSSHNMYCRSYSCQWGLSKTYCCSLGISAIISLRILKHTCSSCQRHEARFCPQPVNYSLDELIAHRSCSCLEPINQSYFGNALPHVPGTQFSPEAFSRKVCAPQKRNPN